MGCLKKGAIISAIVLAALVVFLGIGVALNFIGDSLGRSQGYETGKTEGYQEGQANGYEIGHNEGQSQGYQEGYDEGYAQGYDKGYTEGYDASYEEVLETGSASQNPTYQEMKDFLRRDTTDQRSYSGTIPGAYDCENFASDVCNNAEAEGIRAAVVILEYENSHEGHVIIAFETTDRGLIFIEPQDDCEVRVEIGIGFGNPPNIIERFIVIW